MICYKCHNEMKKKVCNYQVIDYCENCGGIWLDADEFQKILFSMDKTEQSELLRIVNEEKTLQRNKLYIYGVCPRCFAKKLTAIRMFGVTVDKCEHCHGIYFDRNELTKLVNTIQSKNLFYRLYLMIKFYFKIHI